MWTPGPATRGTRKMAAEHSLRQQTKPATPGQHPDHAMDLKERLENLLNSFWEKLQKHAQRAKTQQQDPMGTRERSHGQPGERGSPSGAATDHPQSLTHPSPPGLKAKRVPTRRRRPHRRQLKQRKQQSTHRPPATPTRGRHSGNVRQRVYGQTTQAYSPAWGWRDAPLPPERQHLPGTSRRVSTTSQQQE
ncbi:Hypothetical predicted protein [Pelobates cultripes]|uniref:Uncharacterized protein n=1 Tax=Pelobates cultripes TaxID=61616 RepID=A0AAD1T2F5_PELCU|nr:Hypothetical predicted protein [Pelobates cultripes]